MKNRFNWVTCRPKSEAAPDQSSADPPDVVDGNSKMDLSDGFWMIINESWIGQIQVWVLLKCVKTDVLQMLDLLLGGRPYNNNTYGRRRRYLTSLRVYGNREVDHDEPPYASFPKLLADQNIINPQIIKERMAIAFLTLSFPDLHVIVQFWSFVIDQNHCLLTTLV